MFYYFILLFYSFFNYIEAKPFANSFIEFQLSDSWNCDLAGGDDWTCSAINPEQKPEAIIVLTYRTQKENDTLKNYFELLNNSLEIGDLSEKKGFSKAQYTKYKSILGQDWVDSQHESSELPKFVTRYLATVKNGRSVLITITIYKSKMSYYMPQLYKMVESLKLRNTLPSRTSETGVAGLLGQHLAAIKGKKKVESKNVSDFVLNQKNKSNDNLLYALGLGFVIAVIIFILIKRTKKKKNKRGLFG